MSLWLCTFSISLPSHFVLVLLSHLPFLVGNVSRHFLCQLLCQTLGKLQFNPPVNELLQCLLQVSTVGIINSLGQELLRRGGSYALIYRYISLLRFIMQILLTHIKRSEYIHIISITCSFLAVSPSVPRTWHAMFDRHQKTPPRWLVCTAHHQDHDVAVQTRFIYSEAITGEPVNKLSVIFINLIKGSS